MMGTVHYVGCKDCGVRRGLDKISSVLVTVRDRPQAQKLARRIESQGFRAGLLVSFMSEHQGHDCVLFSEHADALIELLRDEGFKFWKDENSCLECGPGSEGMNYMRLLDADENSTFERCRDCGRKIPGTETLNEKPTKTP